MLLRSGIAAEPVARGAIRLVGGVPALAGVAARLDEAYDALRTVLAPEALLFDMDGVLADVSESYRLAILETAAAFGETFTAAVREGAMDEWRRAKVDQAKQ